MATLPQIVSSHERWLGEHERRLNGYDDELGEAVERLTNLRLEVAKLIALGLLIASILSTTATALIVHYLSPGTHTPAPAVQSRVR